MEINITHTNEIRELDGVKCRVWNGVTARGASCRLHVHLIETEDPRAHEEFDASPLVEQPEPRSFEEFRNRVLGCFYLQTGKLPEDCRGDASLVFAHVLDKPVEEVRRAISELVAMGYLDTVIDL